MKQYRRAIVLLIGTVIAVGCLPISGYGDIADFNVWTLVEDPPHANLTSSVDAADQITLRATAGPIPKGTDIGYQTVNGQDVASSTQGWAFDPTSSFSIAVDYDLSFVSPSGGFSIGMGIGEDRDGTDSAGVLLTSQSGTLLTLFGVARADDVDQTPLSLGGGQAKGRFLVAYDAASGDVTLGVSTNGDDIPETSGTLDAIQNDWDDEMLFASFFARGDNGAFSWSSGTADAVFTNFRVTDGLAVSVPEPSTLLLSLIGAFFAAIVVRRRRMPS